MWHEARKQERKIRGMLVDYRKRAERRRDFYEKIKADPTQFLQVHGRQCKIHLDPAIAAAAEGSVTMMPWQGHGDNLIDRFDVRAHLDIIPTISPQNEAEPTLEERQLNYERYRIIAQNAFLSINEEKFLKQLHLEEQFGYTEHEPKKKKPTGGAAIGFNYEDGTGTSTYLPSTMEDPGSEDNSDSDLDVDLSVNISKIDQTQAHEMNRHGRSFGMSSNDFYSFLTNDIEEAENFKQAKEEEHEKALFSGRKSRRERRAHREKRMANRKISPPCYAARESPTMKIADFHEKSESRSTSPESRKITYITSFGGEEECQTASSKISYADKVKYGSKSSKRRRDERLMMEIRQIYVRSTKNKSFKRGANAKRRRSPSRSRRRRSYSNSSRSRSKSRHRGSSRSPRRRRNRRKRASSSPSSSSSRIANSKKRSFGARKRSRASSRSRSSSSSSRSHSKSSTSCSSTSDCSSSDSKSSAKSLPEAPSKLTLPQSKSPVEKETGEEERPVELQMIPMVQQVAPKVFPRYYGRKKSDQSSSSEIGDSDNEENIGKDASTQNTQNSINNAKIGNSGSSSKTGPTTSISQAERLKRRRQALLAKQFYADKMAEQVKSEREKQEQQTREDEMREMALKSRKKYQGRRNAHDSDSSVSNSRSRTRSKSSSPKNRRSRSASAMRDREHKHRSDRDRRQSRGRDRERVRERSLHRSPVKRDQRSEEKSHRDDRRRGGQREAGSRFRERERVDDKTKIKALVDY